MGGELFAPSVKWIADLRSAPRVILDDEGRIFVILAGRPEGSDWVAVEKEAARVMQHVADKGEGSWRRDQGGEENKRGDFTTLTGGYSMGGGKAVSDSKFLVRVT